MPRFIIDTTVLSNFPPGRPELLQTALGGQAATSEKVMAELHRGEDQELVPRYGTPVLPTLHAGLSGRR